MAAPLKVFILGILNCSLVARDLIRCPTSSSGWGGPVGQGGCPLCSHPLPLRKETSSSSTLGLLSPAGGLQWPEVGPLGAHSIPFVLPPAGDLPLTALVGHPHSPQGPCGIGMGPSHLGGGYMGWLGNLLPIWGWRLGVWGSYISYCYISPQMGGRGRRNMKSIRFFAQICGFGDSTCHNLHFVTGMKQNDQSHCWKLKHTFGVCLSHLNTEFNDVFLLYGSHIE